MPLEKFPIHCVTTMPRTGNEWVVVTAQNFLQFLSEGPICCRAFHSVKDCNRKSRGTGVNVSDVFRTWWSNQNNTNMNEQEQ